MRRLLLLSLCVGAAWFCGPQVVQAATEEEVEASRKLGMQYLLDTQKEDGSWEYAGHEIGITSLCALALIENGTPVDDPVIEKAQRYVLDNYLDEGGTYDVSLAILLLSRVGDRDNRGAIRDLAARLIAGQNLHGGWGYSCPKDVRSSFLSGSGERPDRSASAGDNSCTQFACLGLWVASRSGVNIDDSMAQVAYRFVKDQNEDGGWPYAVDPAKPQGSRNSMTMAGLFCLTVARANRIRAVQQAEADGKAAPKLPDPYERPKVEPTAAQPDPNNPDAAAAPAVQPKTAVKPPEEEETFADPGAESKTLQDDPVFKAGFDMAAKYAAGVGPGASRYFMWSVERMGVILGLEKFGTTDWFTKGADALIASQSKPAGEVEGIEGAWMIASTGSSLSETSFAILFLRKANLGSDITRLLQGEPVEPFQNLSQEAKPRYLKLDQAIAAAKAGDVIQVDSSRPIDCPHLLIDKNLTLTAGPGYNPVFRYEIGFDAKGRRSEPKSDPTARFILGVKGATLTLEGFRLQMTPPKSAGTAPWVGVSVEDGTLRMLNCSVAEDARQGFAAVALTGAGKLELRNCMLVGGRAGIEITAGGEQSISLNNTVLYNNVGVSVLPGKAGDGKLTFNIDRCVVAAPEAFNFAKVTTPIDITSSGGLYFADSLGSNFLMDRSTGKGRTWTGKKNLYDVKKWIGFQGTPNAAIKDAKTWSRFWGDADESGESRVVTLKIARHGSYKLDMNADEFEISQTSQVYGNRRWSGINPIYLGPGYNFSLFREGFDYNAWREQTEQLASAQ